ncbi:hypothetical protein AB0F17_54200 [Nonomuraea sp. NPDC026600]|uniref:hypothetical protein n=1 Tax=Nonomuraea sp. NPDC026600 TaxID=3155363 RepID=UPI0033D13D36
MTAALSMATAGDPAPGYGGFRHAGRTRTPGESSIALLYWSLDQGQTWSCGGELRVPTGHPEAAAFGLLLALKALPLQPPGLQWRVDTWHLPPDAAVPAGPPTASLRSDDLADQLTTGHLCPLCRSTPDPGQR